MKQQKKILAVDDNLVNNAIVQEILGGLYDVKIATTGQEALRIADAFHPDIVLLDIMMPGMDGYEVCRRLRENPTLQYTKIIIISAKSVTAERLEGYQAGADDYITKPFEEDELLAKVRVYSNLSYTEEMEHLRRCFTMTVTHEMRTPLTIVKNILSNAEENVYGDTLPELHHQIEIAQENIHRLGRIISNFFEISRIDAGKLDLQMTSFPVQDWIREAIGKLQPRAVARQITLDTDLWTETRTINADRQKLTMVLTHLVENAIKFIDDGGSITVRVNGSKDQIAIDVQDDGPGILPQDIDTIFDRFVQSQRQVGPGEHGTGLGLAVSRGLVEAHGGTIRAHNRPEGGAVFTFEIPVCAQTDLEAEPVLSTSGNAGT